MKQAERGAHRLVYLVWARYHRRAELLAQHLGGEVRYVAFGRPGRAWEAPLRYLVQAARTWGMLWRERPAVVMVQNPPIFAVAAAAVYCALTGARYAIDSHTGAFISPGWRRTLGLHRFLSRHAAITVVHNRDQEDVVRQWGCPYSLAGFTPGDYPETEPFRLVRRPAVAVVCSFAEDEPVAEILAAAAALPGVGFYITGNPARLTPEERQAVPPNCELTGYLPYDGYVALLRAADAVMVLTKRDHTLLMGGFEAVSLGKPLITSDWPVLRDYFDLGTVHVRNTVEGVALGVRRAIAEGPSLHGDTQRLRDRLEADWATQLAALKLALALD